MDKWDLGRQTGLELKFNVSENTSYGLFFKYYNKHQRLEQCEFFGYLNPESYVWQKYTFESVDLGILIQQKIHSPFSLYGGLGYSIASNNKIEGGYHFYGDNPKTVHLGQIQYRFTPDKILTRADNINLMIGPRLNTKINKVGTFDFGLLFYFPLNKMPIYYYEQILETNDQGTITSNAEYHSKQYSVEFSILYQIATFGKKQEKPR